MKKDTKIQMKISAFQFDVQKDKYKNIEIIQEALNKENTDIIVLPELSSSGYVFESIDELKKIS